MRGGMFRAVRFSALVAAISLNGGGVTAAQSLQAGNNIVYPQTRRVDVVDTQFGVPVADPYRWLENDVRTDGQVRAWVDAQNAVTAGFLQSLPGREALKERLKQLFDYERYGIPVTKGGRYFYTRNNGLQNQSILYVRESLNGEGRELIDPNPWAKDGATALADWVPSENGKHLLYSIQEGGTDWRTLKVRDVNTGADLPDVVEWVKYSAMSWAKDGSGFYYSRYPAPKPGSAYQALTDNHEIYFHKLGTQQSADQRIFATPGRPELYSVGEVSDDGQWLIASSLKGISQTYEVSLVDLKKPTAKPRVLIPGFEHNYSYHRKSRLDFLLHHRRRIAASENRNARHRALQPDTPNGRSRRQSEARKRGFDRWRSDHLLFGGRQVGCPRSRARWHVEEDG